MGHSSSHKASFLTLGVFKKKDWFEVHFSTWFIIIRFLSEVKIVPGIKQKGRIFAATKTNSAKGMSHANLHLEKILLWSPLQGS